MSRVFDVHQHLPAARDDWEPTTEDRLAFMDRFGIDEACLMPPVFRGRASASPLNDALADYRSAHADRFPAALGTVDLDVPAPELRAQIAHVRSLGLAGVVWHHMFDGRFLDATRTLDAITACAEHDLLIAVHVIVGSLVEAPWRLGEICKTFPEVTVIALDGLSSPHHGQWLIQLAREHRNLVLDTAVLASYGNLVERFVAAVGDDRLLLGTDFDVEPKPFAFPYPLAEIEHADLTPQARARILGENARRLFRLAPAGVAA